MKLNYLDRKPSLQFTPFVHSIWQIDCVKASFETEIMPDGMCDIIYVSRTGTLVDIVCTGIWTTAKQVKLHKAEVLSGIRLKPLGVEYILQRSISDIKNNSTSLRSDILFTKRIWSLDFHTFYMNVEHQLSKLSNDVDERKRLLFEIIFQNGGNVSLEAIHNYTFWSRRQILRYFTDWFGVSTNQYLQIVRFKSSLKTLYLGIDSPLYYDKSHQNKQVRKYSGTTPSMLKQGNCDRFIQQFSRK